MPRTHIRSLDFGEILDTAFTLYRRRFVDLFLTVLFPFLLVSVLSARLIATGLSFDFTLGSDLVGLSSVVTVVSVVATVVVLGSLTHHLSRAYEGEAVSLGEGYGVGLRRSIPLAFSLLVSFIVIGVVWMALGMGFGATLAFSTAYTSTLIAPILFFVLGLAVVIVVGVAVAASFFAVVPAVIVEGAGPFDALVRSWRLSHGSRARILGIFFVSWVITLLPTLGMTLVLGLGATLYDPSAFETLSTAQVYTQQIVGAFTSALTLPFGTACMILLYFDRRVRAEGYDIEVVADALAPVE